MKPILVFPTPSALEILKLVFLKARRWWTFKKTIFIMRIAKWEESIIVVANRAVSSIFSQNRLKGCRKVDPSSEFHPLAYIFLPCLLFQTHSLTIFVTEMKDTQIPFKYLRRNSITIFVKNTKDTIQFKWLCSIYIFIFFI